MPLPKNETRLGVLETITVFLLHQQVASPPARVPMPCEVVQHEPFGDDDEPRVFRYRGLDYLQGLIHDRAAPPTCQTSVSNV